jgi:hypothetical protein
MVVEKTKVSTWKNTNLTEWTQLLHVELAKQGAPELQVSDLRVKHAWEGGDTPYGYADFLVRQRFFQKRTADIKRDNPWNHA